MYISGKFISQKDDLTDAFYIRRKVFVEEQRIPKEMEFDDLDKWAVHVIAFEITDDKLSDREGGSGKPVATGRITFDGDICRIGRIAVLKEYRGRKYGDFVVRMLLDKAFYSGIKEVTIHAQKTAEKFYEKIGFKKVGNYFKEAGIDHCEMVITPLEMRKGCSKNSKLYGV